MNSATVLLISIALIACAGVATGSCVHAENQDMLEYVCTGGHPSDLDAIPRRAEKIRIRNMIIPIVTADIFSRFGSNLWVLSCSFCGIMNIKDNAFRKLVNLQQLDLDSNHITTVRGSWFEGLDYLTYLDLGYNDISVIEDDVFKNLPNLVDFRLSGNNLECLNLEAMSHLQNLRRMFLSENKEMKCPNAISAFLESRGVIFERDPEWRRIPVDLVRAGMHVQQVEHPATPVYVVPAVTVRTPIEATTHESHLNHETLHRELEADSREHPVHYPLPETTTYVHPIHYPTPERTTAYAPEIHYPMPERTTTYAPEIHYPTPQRTTTYAPEIHYPTPQRTTTYAPEIYHPMPERTTAYAPPIHYTPAETTTYSTFPHYPAPESGGAATAPPMHYPEPETTTNPPNEPPIRYPTYERTADYAPPVHYPTPEGTTTAYTPAAHYPRFETTPSNPPMHYPTTPRTTSSMSHEGTNENLETTPRVPVMHYPTADPNSHVGPTHHPYPETSPSILDTRHDNLKPDQESESRGSEINEPPPEEIDPSGQYPLPETSPSSSEHDESDQYGETDAGSQYYDYYDPYDPTPFQLPIPTDESEQETPAPVDQTTRGSTWRYDVAETPPLPVPDESKSRKTEKQTFSVEKSENFPTQSIIPENHPQTSDVYTQKPSPSHADTITKTEHPSDTARENEFHRHPHLPSEATWPSMLAPSPTERSETPTSFVESNVARATGLPSVFWTEDTDDYNGEIDHEEYDRPTEYSGSESTHMTKSYEPALPPDTIQPASPDDFFQAPYDEPTVTIRPPSTLQNYRQRENAMPVQPMDPTTTTTDKPLPDCAGGMTSIFRSMELIVICALVAGFQQVLVGWV